VHQFMRKPTSQKRIDLSPLKKWAPTIPQNSPS
jgi:hypothetical protein